jgi:hypothetical protein
MKVPALATIALATAFSCWGQTSQQAAWWAKEKGITAGRVIKGSISPDGKFALFEFNHWEGSSPDGVTTITGIGLAPIDRSKLLYVIDSNTKWSTDREVPSFLTFIWNSSSTLLATHDSHSKNSKVRIYQIQDGRARSLDIPDLFAAAGAELDRSSILSSGQIPKRWIANDCLEVDLRISTKEKKLTLPVKLVITGDNGLVSIRK